MFKLKSGEILVNAWFIQYSDGCLLKSFCHSLKMILSKHVTFG